MTCGKCGAKFKWKQSGRGRPRKYCDSCRRVDGRRRSANAKVGHPARSCSQCGASFLPTNALNIYCSRRCKDQGKPSAVGLPCRICGEAMIRGSTSATDGTGAHNRCRAQEHNASRYESGCRCDVCRDSIAARNRDYRARRHAEGRPVPAGGRWIGIDERLEIYGRDEGVCQLCFKPVDFEADFMDASAPTLDHILPRSLGGSDDPENLRLACRGCNCARSNRLDWEADDVSR